MTITPVVLCGGSGTRLWPVSRKSYPKQFAPLLGRESLFQASARRLSGGLFGAPVVVTADAFRFIVAEQLAEAGIAPEVLLVEPEGRDTAPAVLAATVRAGRAAPGALLLVAPSDHVIPDAARFQAAVAAGMEAAAAGRIVTFGIRPDRPETGYGYLELAGGAIGGEAGEGRVADLARFVEKPDAARAAAMVADGRHLWNAGLFLYRADVMLALARRHVPALLEAVEAAVAGARADLGFCRLDPAAWGRAERVSIDYAVMERAGGLAVVPYAGRWSDLGDWAAVWRETGGHETAGHETAGPAGHGAGAGAAGAGTGTGAGAAPAGASPDASPDASDPAGAGPEAEAGAAAVPGAAAGAGAGAGNALSGPVTALDCAGSLLRAEAPGQRVVGIGLHDMIAVAMPDAVLVAPRARAQEVKEAVAALRAEGAAQAEAFPRDHRPWGWFESLARGTRFQVKRIVVHPGAALSLQSHHHRSEHWIVVEGTARVTIGDEVRLLSENQSVYIPLGSRHRLDNPGKLPMVLIEVQTGPYLGEDDIVRYEDLYARG